MSPSPRTPRNQTATGTSLLILSIALAGAILAPSCSRGSGREHSGNNLPLPLTPEDFRVPGSQHGDVNETAFLPAQHCGMCHAGFDPENEPVTTWQGSLMAHAGRDPLYFAQLTTAKQDVNNVEQFCTRCHVPTVVITGTTGEPTHKTTHPLDQEGVTCILCHSMVDPNYVEGTSPSSDLAILEKLAHVPSSYGNAQFVLDPNAVRRGPRAVNAPHDTIESSFHKSGKFCGTCHDVGNVATTRQPDGTYRYNMIGESAADANPISQFPLERTYTEWKLSEFAATGVDMGGRFGGTAGPVVSTCQDCHMPAVAAQACWSGPIRSDMRKHDFAGSAEWVLGLIAMAYATEPGFDVQAVLAGREKALNFLARAGSLELVQQGDQLHVRAINETGHKLPTGHIEGRRAWVNVVFRDSTGAILEEYGAYEPQTAILDTSTVNVYEMHVGLSADAAAVTGLPAGVTGHMALADTIEKDTRIPPRGFSNAAFAAAGAPVVGTTYAEGQYWDDQQFSIPIGALTAEVKFLYQVVTRDYIEHLRESNHTDNWGEILHGLWLLSGRAVPREMASASIQILP